MRSMIKEAAWLALRGATVGTFTGLAILAYVLALGGAVASLSP